MPVFDVNEPTQTGTLQIYSGATAITSYSFAADTFTLSKLDAVALTASAIRTNLSDISLWFTLLHDKLQPERGNQRPWDVLYDRPNGTLRFRFRMVGTEGKISDATCDLTTQVVTVDVRPKTTLSVREFQRWIGCWHLFMQLCGELA